MSQYVRLEKELDRFEEEQPETNLAMMNSQLDLLLR